MQYSPKLKKVMEQIKSILKENDIAGMIILHTIQSAESNEDKSASVAGFSEYLFHINTSYSAASIENGRLMVKAKSEHYPTKAERNKKLAGAINMLKHFSECGYSLSQHSEDMEKMIAPMVEKIESSHGNHTSNEQQNN